MKYQKAKMKANDLKLFKPADAMQCLLCTAQMFTLLPGVARNSHYLFTP
jgi:hypothetical protein